MVPVVQRQVLPLWAKSTTHPNGPGGRRQVLPLVAKSATHPDGTVVRRQVLPLVTLNSQLTQMAPVIGRQVLPLAANCFGCLRTALVTAVALTQPTGQRHPLTHLLQQEM